MTSTVGYSFLTCPVDASAQRHSTYRHLPRGARQMSVSWPKQALVSGIVLEPSASPATERAPGSVLGTRLGSSRFVRRRSTRSPHPLAGQGRVDHRRLPLEIVGGIEDVPEAERSMGSPTAPVDISLSVPTRTARRFGTFQRWQLHGPARVARELHSVTATLLHSMPDVTPEAQRHTTGLLRALEKIAAVAEPSDAAVDPPVSTWPAAIRRFTNTATRALRQRALRGGRRARVDAARSHLAAVRRLAEPSACCESSSDALAPPAQTVCASFGTRPTWH